MNIYKGTAVVILAAILLIVLFLGRVEFDRWLIRVNHPTSVQEFINISRKGEGFEQLVVYSCFRQDAEKIIVFDCFDHESAAQVEVDFDPVCLRLEERNHMVGVMRFREEGPVLSYGMFYELSDDEVRRVWSCGRKPWWLRVK